MVSSFNYSNYKSKTDVWDADEKAKDTRNYTTPEQLLESLQHIMERFSKLKGNKIYPFKSSFTDVMDDDILNKLCYDPEFQKFAEENYALFIRYDKVKKVFIFDKF